MRREVGAGMTACLGFLCAPVLSKSLLHVPASLAYPDGESLGGATG